ncbi:MAG TPA: TetR/AcrR family transcriptional regulator [Marmoricola sp.]|nr:TetR/AcrR family transcriptional regulator [Marmoricola sp.]
MKSKRTQADRTAATRAALVGAARPLFAAHGYAAVGTDEIARDAGVTRGALYHQYDGKLELFAAVFEQVEAELAERIATEVSAVEGEDMVRALHVGVDAWLAASAEPAVHRLVLIEAPAALGWERWREIGRRYGVGLVQGAVQEAIAAGVLAPQPVGPISHVLIGALEEAVLYAARAEDRAAATEEVRAALHAVIDGLVVPGTER